MKRILLLFVFLFSYFVSSAQLCDGTQLTINETSWQSWWSPDSATDYQLSAAFDISNYCDSVSLSDNTETVNSPVVKRTWYFGDGRTDTSRHPIYAYSKTGYYNIRLVVENSLGAKDSITRNYYYGTGFPVIQFKTNGYIDTLREMTYYPHRNHAWYEWYRNDKEVEASENGFLVNPAEGTYKVRVLYDGCFLQSDPFEFAHRTDTTVDYSYSHNLCQPQIVSFLPKVKDSLSIAGVRWEFGDSTSTTEYAPVKTYRFPGTHTVTLRVTRTSGYAYTVTRQINIPSLGEPLNAVVKFFSGYGQDTLAAFPKNFSNDTYVYNWYRGNTLISPGSTTSPHLRNPVSGIYKVAVTTLTGCSDTSDPYVFIRRIDSVKADFTYSHNPCDSQLVSFSSILTGPLELDTVAGVYWNFGDNAYSSEYQPVHRYVSGGQYTVTMRMLKRNGSDTIILKSIMVNRSYQWGLSIAIDSVTTPGVYHLTAMTDPAYPGIQVQWNTGDTTQTIAITGSGTYIAWVKDDCGNVRASDTVNIHIKEDAPWSLDVSWYYVSECADIARLTAETDATPGAYVIEWNNSTVGDYTYATSSGSYIATLKDTLGNIRAVDTIHVEIAERFTASIVLLPSPFRNNDTLLALPYDGHTSYRYQWYRNGTFLSQGSSNILHAPAEGTYEVMVFNTGGCGDTSAAFIYKLPVDTVPAVPDTVHLETGVVSDTLAVTASFQQDFNADNVFNVQLAFDKSGGREPGLQEDEVISLGTISSRDKNVAIKISVPDSLACASNYVLRIVASSPADTTSWSQPFTIINQPEQPVITQRGDSLFTTGKYHLQWYKNGEPVAGATNAYYRARANAAYTVEAQNGTGCTSMSEARSVVITAVDDVVLGGNTVKAYPNPSAGKMYLQFGKPLLKTVTIKVYDLKGQVHYTRTTLQQQQPLDLTQLPKGYYFIELTGYGTRKVLSVILQ